MADQFIIEMTRLVVIGATSSGIVAYFFNRRLKRIASYEAITNQLMSRMLKGMEELLGFCKKLHETFIELENAVARGEPALDDLKSFAEQIRSHLGDIRQCIRSHRIYITPLVPLGNSHEWEQVYIAVVIVLHTLIDEYSKPFAQRSTNALQSINKIAPECHARYHELCGEITRIIKQIHSGKAIL